MDDETFSEIRDALAPGREREGRMGALFILEASLDDDDRLHSLLATLLRDRDAEVAAACAALIYRDKAMRETLSKELAFAWSRAAPEYRVYLLQAADPATLKELSEDVLEVPDVALKLGFLQRLNDLADAERELECALYLSRDASADVRDQALAALIARPTPGTRAAIWRLLADDAPSVRARAAAALPDFCDDLDAAIKRLRELGDDADLDVRGAAAEGARALQAKLNAQRSDALIEEQRELIDAGEYHKAMAVASRIFMQVAEHPEAMFQMSRAACGLGDVRRGIRLLANALEAGLEDAGRALDDPIFDPAREAEIWGELLAMIQERMAKE